MDAEFTIIGAGVVGLAAGQKLSENNSSVYIIEKHQTFGQETSSRNSEVIHAGIYYPANSLKARLCVQGKDLLYDYCMKYDVPFNKCGKLVVATDEEETHIIEGVRQSALKNGVKDLVIMDRDEIASLEPNIFALKAVFSPSTGIIDTHALMKQYETNMLNNGGQIAYGNEVTGIRKAGKGYEITVSESDGGSYTFTSRIVINSGGLSSDTISGMAGIYDEKLRISFCKGEYFRVIPPKNRLVSRLIYPVPHPLLEHIGVHVTIDMSGGVKLGPDFEYLPSDEYDYRITPGKQEFFYSSAKKYLPFLEYDDISPDMAGIRPKLQKHGEPFRDYYIMEESGRGYPGFINLIGMESPALTSSLAIADYIAALI